MTREPTGVGLEIVEYHPESEMYRAQYDPGTTAASTAVVAALADVLDTDPAQLDPLYATVDTDALTALVRVRDTANGEIRVTFTHGKYAITVSSYGVVVIAPRGHERTSDQTAGVPRK
ncbi:HalOD1 output domain-containing protein [Halomarina pelagica]|uniref:HalOD1 output domain-containing protein n=1 Tax=Halomarina pelagica TaxID=2961599 RepID=UPI0020C39DA0|nr:HalOD1 output domain-containing protein [Halomarina sp. BND7]